jgi:uncharacterized protein (AIM24 family)
MEHELRVGESLIAHIDSVAFAKATAVLTPVDAALASPLGLEGALVELRGPATVWFQSLTPELSEDASRLAAVDRDAGAGDEAGPG